MNEKKMMGWRKVFCNGYKYIQYKLQLILSIVVLSLVFSSTVNAHRGENNDVDTCRFSVGSEVIHFSAYTPTFTAGTSYCHYIPDIGLTHLVFDYEGNKLRHTTVEFEITKEPDATRIFYQKPQIIKKGSVNAKVDFQKYGAGDYLAHITIVYKGEKLDSHLPFSVGVKPKSEGFLWIIISALVIAALMAYAATRIFKLK